MRRLLVVLAASAVAVTAHPGASATTGSGLRGLVTLYPARPVCVEGQPCSRPAAATVLAFRRDGKTVKRVRTDAGGRYRVLLRPGRYTVTAPRYRAGTGVTPRAVRVPRDRIVRVHFVIDTGIQ